MELIDAHIRCRRSEALDKDGQESLTRFANREEEFITRPNYFEEVRNKLRDTLSIKPAEEAPKINKLVDGLEKNLLQLGVDLLDEVYEKQAIHEEITDEEKLLYFSAYLSKGNELKDLNVDLQRGLLAYINKIDEEIKDDYEDINVPVLNDLDDKTEEILNHLRVITKGGDINGVKYSENLKEFQSVLKVGAFDEQVYKNFLENFRQVGDIFESRNKYFEQHKDKLPKGDRERLERKWEEIKEAYKKIEELVAKWEAEVGEYKGISEGFLMGSLKIPTKDMFDMSKNGLIDLENMISEDEEKIIKIEAISDLIKRENRRGNRSFSGETDKVRISHFIQNVRTNQDKREKFIKALKELQGFSFTKVDLSGNYYKEVEGIEINKAKASTGKNLADLNTRFKNKLQTKFLEQLEAQYLAKLEKNTADQFDILQQLPEGATVTLHFKETTNLSHLQMPKDLNKKETEPKLRVIRKEEGYVVLEGDGKVYVLNGPSVVSGKAKSNLGIYESGKASGKGAPKDFTVKHTNPNQQAIILSMQIS